MGLLDDAIREHLELKRRHGADAREIARQEREALGPVVRGELAIPDPGLAAALEEEPHYGAGAVAVEHADEDPFAPRTAETGFFDDPAPDDPAADATTVDPPAPATPVAPQDAGQPTVAFSLADLEAAEAVPAADAPAPASEPAAATPAEPAPPEPPVPAADERPRAAPTPLPPPADTPPPATAATPPPAETPGQELSWDAPATADDADPPREVAEDVVPADQEPEEHDELEETPEFLQETPEHDRLWFEQRPPRDFDF
jgi:hypothetical protein